MHKHNKRIESELEIAQNTAERIKIFSDFFYDEKSSDLRCLYKMFTGISLLSPQEEMKTFQTECFDYYYAWFEKIIDEGIASKELDPSARQMTGAMFATAKGMFIISQTTNKSPTERSKPSRSLLKQEPKRLSRPEVPTGLHLMSVAVTVRSIRPLLYNRGVRQRSMPEFI